MRVSCLLVWVGALAAAAPACSSSPSPGYNGDDAGSGDDGGAGDAAPDVACIATQIACGGACVDPGTDAANCGACGRACGAGEACCHGASCSSDPACAFSVTSLSTASGFVNGGTYVTLHGTGFAAGMRAYLGDGRAPAWVVDAQTARVITPPSPAGLYDVRVRLGAASAALPMAFTVAAGRYTAQWTEITMSTPRGNFPAMTTLQDGRVLVVGGSATSNPSTTLASAELYDPVTSTTAVAAGAMSVPRNTVSAITLLDGRALVVGTCNIATGPGCVTAGDRAIADLFDPATNTFTATKTPLGDSTRVYMKLALLPDGHVLVVSGGTAEVFDPSTDSFAPLTVPSKSGGFGWPARLRDGRVLFVGGGFDVYDPDAVSVSLVPGSLTFSPAAVYTVPDGRVGCVGGTLPTNNGMVTPTDALAAIDPKAGQVTTLTQKLSSPRLKFGSALLGDGTIMVAGGVEAPYPITFGCQSDTFPTTASVDSVDFQATSVSPLPPLLDKNMELVATTLPDGSILVGGGAACGGAGAYPYLYFLKGLPASK
jgi:hypothetical protein